MGREVDLDPMAISLQEAVECIELLRVDFGENVLGARLNVIRRSRRLSLAYKDSPDLVV